MAVITLNCNRWTPLGLKGLSSCAKTVVPVPVMNETFFPLLEIRRKNATDALCKAVDININSTVW